MLVRPMLSLTDRASFRVEQDGERVELVVSGLGVQLVDDDDATVTYSFTKIADFEQNQAGLSITVKTKEGNLSVLALETSSVDLADDILCADDTMLLAEDPGALQRHLNVAAAIGKLTEEDMCLCK